MDTTPLTWLESLKPDSVNSWQDLKTTFTNHYVGAMQHPSNRIDLAQVKQHQDETLQSYLRCFFDKKATIIDILEQDVIDCFQNGLYDHHMF